MQTRPILVTYSRRVTNGGSRSGTAAAAGMWRRRRRKKRRWMEKLSETEAGWGKTQGWQGEGEVVPWGQKTCPKV